MLGRKELGVHGIYFYPKVSAQAGVQSWELRERVAEYERGGLSPPPPNPIYKSCVSSHSPPILHFYSPNTLLPRLLVVHCLFSVCLPTHADIASSRVHTNYRSCQLKCYHNKSSCISACSTTTSPQIV